MMRVRIAESSRIVAKAPTVVVKAATPATHHLPSSFRNAVVIGAGPAGSLAACYLAQRGYTVHVFDNRPRPEPRFAETIRSYPIVTGDRAMRAISEVVDVPDKGLFSYKGYVVLGGLEGNQKIVFPASEDQVLMSRTELCYHLICQAEKRFPDAINFTFNAPCMDVDLASRTVRLDLGGAGVEKKQYDLLIGADGGGSIVRQAMMRLNPEMTATALDSPHARMVYKTFHNLPGYLAPQLLRDDQPKQPGMWLYEVRTPRPGASLSFWPRKNGSYSGIMRAPRDLYGELHSEEDYHQLVEASMKELPQEWVTDICRQLVQAPVNNFHPGLIISHCVADSVVILGDAAHPITPAAGQGANAALEDCRLLAQALDRHPESLQRGLEEYQAAKQPESRALVLMDNLFDWSAMGPKVASKLTWPGKLHFRVCQYQMGCYRQLSSVLETLLPEEWLHAVRRPMNATSYANSLHCFRLVTVAVTCSLAVLLMGVITATARAALLI